MTDKQKINLLKNQLSALIGAIELFKTEINSRFDYEGMDEDETDLTFRAS